MVALDNLGLKKRFPFDALTLGAARVANLWIGFHIAGAALTGGTLLYSLGYLLWIGGITAASRCEDVETVQTRRLGLILAWFLKLAALILLACLAESAARSAAFLLPLALLTFFLVRTVRDGSREGVMLYILRCLQLIILVHATTLWARVLTGAVISQLVCAAISFFLLAALAPRRRPS